jgi:branched-subunit amino acid aminotransferase/4-amino-4-deoxychorismate lyase
MRHHSPALIETIRIRNGVAPLWYLHLRRLALSCKALGIPLPSELPPPEGGPDRVYRMQIGMRGVQVSERLLESTAPVRLIISRVAHHSYPYKTTDRAQFDRALDTARGVEADDALMLTPGGFVAETTICSLLWWEGSTLCGPAFDLGVLAGVGRARLTELAGQIEERYAAWSEIRERAPFLVNSVRGVVKISAVQGEPVPRSGETNTLAARFWP